MWVPMTTTCFSTDLHPIVSGVSIKRFTKTQTGMSFIHQSKVFPLFDIVKILICDLSDIMTTNHESIVLSHSGNNFILLSLILDDWLLNSWRVFELFSPAWVPCGWDYRKRVYFWWRAADMLTDWHHCCITYFWITLFLYLTSVTDWCKPSQHVFLRNDNVMQ